ncbi:hypothetical protein GC098_16770 [Paenibacillus sp. LMG 31458]|uniref:Heparin-sulfate lyase N-terminal domain-containing protein n=1 Tax=Paenibacillus phytorum TaxID=2654977 RepID=A0ABX1XWX7_9BACL|nr:heparinase II/III family protein [Paenibacillus phytorum]NOU73052.1 hypothetical protein [Paenibacillus phytorum]
MTHEITLLDRETDITDKHVFEALNLNYPGLQKVKKALEQGNEKLAKHEVVEYFHNRKNRTFLFDYRGMPLRPIDPDASPLSYQSSNGLEGSLKELCLKVAEKMMNNIYLLPTGKRGEHFLGAHFENMLLHNALTDNVTRHRYPHDMFTRGQFFESLAVAYHENGDPRIAGKFREILEKFFETYQLIIENKAADAGHWMLTDDRDAMSVGGLTLVMLTLFYTELPYTLPDDLAFKIIGRICFFGSQYRRFDTDTYRPHNHHLWERGVLPYILAVMLPEFPVIEAMKPHSREVILAHFKDDFNPSGGYGEHSTSYWAGATIGDMLFRAVTIARLNNDPLMDEGSLACLEKSISVLTSIVQPTERFPSIGDNQGTSIEPFLLAAMQMTENQLPAAVLAVRRGETVKEEQLPSLDYCDNTVGFVASRSSWKRDSNYFIMSIKENCGVCGHNHMDMLSLIMILRGKQFIGEPYSGALYHKIRMNSDLRGFMYNMESHNTVLVHGSAVQPNRMYANQWGVYRPDVCVSRYETNPKGMLVQGYHDAYTFCRHQRTVVFSRAKGWIVKDKIERGMRQQQKHIQRWFLELGVACEVLEDRVLLLKKENVQLLCVWESRAEVEVKLWKKKDLYPDIISDPEQINYAVDISFLAKDSEQTDQENEAVLHVAMLDVTDRAMPDFQDVRKIFVHQEEELMNLLEHI